MWSNRNLIVICLLLLSATSWGLESDKNQPIHISADHITVDDKKGFSLYRGNVVLTQGTLHVTGETIKVYLNKNKLKRVIVLGKPATLRQKPEPEQPVIKSRAERMEYNVVENFLLLTTNAEVEQGPNRFSGDNIRYNIATSTVTAEKKKNGENGDDGSGRVSVTIDPSTQQKETPEADQ